MAEVVGVIGVVPQFIDLAVKLKELWTQLRDAPEEVNELVEVISLYDQLLKTSAQRPAQSVLVEEGRLPEEAIEYFKQCLDPLRKLTTKLESNLRRHKHTSRLHHYLRKADLDKCQERLRKSLNIVLLAQQRHTAALLDHNNSRILQRLEAIERSIQFQTSKDETSAKHTRTRIKTKTTNKVRSQDKPRMNAKSLAEKQKKHQSSLCKSGSTPVFSIKLHAFALWKSFQVSIARSSHSFGIHFRIYNILPHTSKLFTASRQGKWKHVRSMITNKTACPFDVDEGGTTLLYIAASQGRADVCRFLLSCGLNTSDRAGIDQRTPFEALALAFRLTRDVEPNVDASLETARLLMPSGHESNLSYMSTFKYCSLPATVLSMLITAWNPSYQKVDSLTRSKFATSTSSNDPNAVSVLLGQNLSLVQALKLTRKASNTNYGPRRLLANIIRCLVKLKPNEALSNGWNDIASQTISFESQNTATFEYRSLYIQYIACHLYARRTRLPSTGTESWNETLTAIGRHWLQFLVDHGANLKRFGKAEKATLQHPETIVWEDVHENYHCFRTKFLLTGPNIDDWKLFVGPHVHKIRQNPRKGIPYACYAGHHEYEMAGEFWYMVEHPELFCIPGAWQDDVEIESDHGKPVKVKGPIF